jgi:hypothetical protein
MAKKATKTKTARRRVLSGGRRGGKANSQALMRVRVKDPDNLLIAPDVVHGVVLSEQPRIGNRDAIELKLSKAEELELAQPVNPAEVLIKPTGQPYLPHKVYTLWFIRAFGRFGWSLVPRGTPVMKPIADKEDGGQKGRHLVLVPYSLNIHGHPVADAWGEQEYNESNAEQTYGDAVESSVANALRRCAKRIGVGLELWDKDWLERWRDEHAVQVWIKGYGKQKNYKRWRRKKDKPLPFEIGKDARKVTDDVDGDFGQEEPPPPGDSVPPRRDRPAAGNDGNGGEKITKPQRQRLATIARKAGRNDADVRLWLIGKWKVKTSADILRKDYDAVCRELEARGPLAIPGDGGQ